jgi:hypothetical protein
MFEGALHYRCADPLALTAIEGRRLKGGGGGGDDGIDGAFCNPSLPDACDDGAACLYFEENPTVNFDSVVNAAMAITQVTTTPARRALRGAGAGAGAERRSGAGGAAQFLLTWPPLTCHVRSVSRVQVITFDTWSPVMYHLMVAFSPYVVVYFFLVAFVSPATHRPPRPSTTPIHHARASTAPVHHASATARASTAHRCRDVAPARRLP